MYMQERSKRNIARYSRRARGVYAVIERLITGLDRRYREPTTCALDRRQVEGVDVVSNRLRISDGVVKKRVFRSMWQEIAGFRTTHSC